MVGTGILQEKNALLCGTVNLTQVQFFFNCWKSALPCTYYNIWKILNMLFKIILTTFRRPVKLPFIKFESSFWKPWYNKTIWKGLPFFISHTRCCRTAYDILQDISPFSVITNKIYWNIICSLCNFANCTVEQFSLNTWLSFHAIIQPCYLIHSIKYYVVLRKKIILQVMGFICIDATFASFCIDL